MTPSPALDGAVLVVYPFCLDHVGHGNIQRILAIARYLVSRGLAVDLVYQGSPRVAPVAAQYREFRRVFAVEGGAASSDAVACDTRLQQFYSGHDLPPVHMRPSAPLTTLVRALLDGEPYRAVVATYAFTAPIFAGLRRKVFTVCDVQDVMHEHAAACARATGHASSFAMPATTEAFLWRQWDAVVAITPDDEARIARDLRPGQHLVSARHAASCASAAAPGADDLALYAASDNQSNVQSVTWLLEQVWPRVRAVRPSARLRMAGLICAAVPAPLRDTPGLELLGFQDDITAELASCGVLVAPYLYGSGLKIKVVEAACAGKAVVTTAAGLAGSGLVAGRALEVHDEAAAFADALSALLGDARRRRDLAESARRAAAALYSAVACYEPIVSLIRMFGVHTDPATTHAVDPSALDRLRVVVEQMRPTRLVVWGNGSFTRGLLSAASSMALGVDVIVDGRASAAGISTEGVRVMPKALFAHAAGDLIVLASETFEAEMWRELTAHRDAGGCVLGLCDPRLISRGLRDRLSGAARAALGVVSSWSTRRDAAATVMLWDAAADASRWWRLHRQHTLATALAARGVRPIVACRATVARRPDIVDAFPRDIDVLPVIEGSGDDHEHRDVDGGVRGLVAVSALATTIAGAALERLQPAGGDRLVVLEPSLTDLLGLARALAARLPDRVPTVELWMDAPMPGALHLEQDAERAYWRLAVETLRDATGRRLTIVAPTPETVAAWSACLASPVHVAATTGAGLWRAPRQAAARLVCFGAASTPGVRERLEALSAAAVDGPLRGMQVAWRADQHDASPSAGPRWASDLAFSLQVELLDAATPAAVATAIASATAVCLLSERGAPWEAAVRQLASAAATPVILSETPAAVVARAAALLTSTQSVVPHGVPSHAFAPEIRP